MEFIKIRFTNDFDLVGSQFQKTITEMFHSMNPMFAFSKGSWKPQVDMYETSEEIIIFVEIAGVEKKDLDLEINSRAVKISGRRLLTPPAQKGRYRLAEIQYGAFERMLYLPAPVDTVKAAATYEKGLLEIRLPKQKHANYSIPISTE
jgi:HSP20 family protein